MGFLAISLFCISLWQKNKLNWTDHHHHHHQDHHNSTAKNTNNPSSPALRHSIQITVLLWSLRPINQYLLVWLFCCLPQVVLAFHAGRLGASSSFMGKGVTYYSSLCLAHLTHEMALTDPTQVSHCLSYYSLSQDYWDTLLSSCPPSPPPPPQPMLVCKMWWVNLDNQHWQDEETGQKLKK